MMTLALSERTDFKQFKHTQLDRTIQSSESLNMRSDINVKFETTLPVTPQQPDTPHNMIIFK